MRRKAPPPESAADVWLGKVQRSLESARAVATDTPAPEVKFVLRALALAELLGSGGPRSIIVRLDEPECFTCGKSTVAYSEALLHCSFTCQEVGRYVRDLRKKVEFETPWDADLLSGLGSKMAHWVSTGRPYRRPVPRKTRDAVFARDGGRCVVCGKHATQIDHKLSDSADMSNLQAMCADCNREKFRARFVPSADGSKPEAVGDKLSYFAELVSAPSPLTPGFDHATWNVKRKEYARLRKRKMLNLNARLDEVKRRLGKG